MSEKNQNVMPIPTKEKFSLSKVKLLKDGGLDIMKLPKQLVMRVTRTNTMY